MPSTSKKILEQLGNGHVTEKPEILFQRMDLEEVMKKVKELHPKVEEKERGRSLLSTLSRKMRSHLSSSEQCSSRLERSLHVDTVKKSKKLLCSQVKVGAQVKQIVSGIKAHYTPEEMVGAALWFL